MQTYDEDRDLTKYVWGHCQHLMTEFERRVGRAVVLGEKRGPFVSSRVFEPAGNGNEAGPEVQDALADGMMAFRRRTRERVLRDHGDDVVKRCPSCRRVLRTPKARQGFNCGYSSRKAGSA